MGGLFDQFPKDYRHGVKWYEADVSKWCIYLWEVLGKEKVEASHPQHF